MSTDRVVMAPVEVVHVNWAGAQSIKHRAADGKWYHQTGLPEPPGVSEILEDAYQRMKAERP